MLTIISFPFFTGTVCGQILIDNQVKLCYFFQCNLCMKTFGGIQELELHNCPAAIRKPSGAPSTSDTSQLSIVPQLREVRIPEKHALILNQAEDQDGCSPNKKPRLTILPQQSQHIPVKSMMNHTTGGIVTVSKAPVQSVHHHGGMSIFYDL